MTKRFFVVVACIFLSGISSALAQGVVNPSSDSFDDATLERGRNEYWNSIRTAGEEKDLSVIERKAYEGMRNLENRSMFKTLSSAAWVPIGSSVDGHSSGRIRDVAFDPTNNKIVYIAAASGGIWKTNDISARPVQWINLSDRLQTTNFGAIAVDPSNPNVLFAGSGEPEGDGYQHLYGTGLYKSTDGGNNWNLVIDNAKTPWWCAQILIDATNPQRIYVLGASGVNAEYGIGFMKSSDGGTTWKTVDAKSTRLVSLSYNPSVPNRLYAGGFGVVSISTDFGDTWTKVPTTAASGSGLVPPSGTSFGRISVACAPSAPQTIYASVGNGSTRKTLGIWLSNDSGATWTMKSQYDPSNSSSANPLGNQQEWCNAIAISPTQASKIIVGGLDVYVSGNSGGSFQHVGYWTDPITSSKYVHADIHRLVFADNTTVYACTDGGLAVSSSATSFGTWATDVNQGLATMQFVGADADKNFTYTLGGCQDNGTLRAYVTSPEFHLTRSGDGGRTWISPDDGAIAYTTYVYSSFYKSLDSGKTFGGTNLIQQNTSLYRDDVNGGGTGEGAPFYPAYDVSSDGTVIAFGGNTHVWISLSGGEDGFNDHHSDKTIGGAYTIHLSKQDPNFMFAGAGTSVWKSADEGYTWTSKSVGEIVTGITTDPRDHTKVYVVTQGTGATLKHFYVSTDGGSTFTAPSTQLTGIPCWSVAFDPASNRIFAGTDNGMAYSEDSGVTWNALTNGMPYTRVTSLKIKGNYLLASTYGRGLFWLDMSTISGVATSAGTQSLRIDGITPNPLASNTATVNFTLPASGYSEIRLFDVLGREIKVIDKNFYEAGSHVVRFSKDGLSSGSYLATLISAGRTVSAKLVIE